MDLAGLFLIAAYVSLGVRGELERPRGVAISKAMFYNSNKDFTCLDGSATIKFNKVNDDYCDCADGSDEPGTAACPNGSFHCTNEGHKPKYIPSSRVNDGLCDCCDGTDEHDGHVKCANYCRELGKQMREEQEKEGKRALAGHEIYLEYVKKGTEARQEKEIKLEELKAEKEGLEGEKNELENLKKEAEAPEKEAKDKHHEAWEVEKQRRRAERNHKTMEDAFAELDVTKDGIISIEEMQKHREFDIDSNGEVSDEEAKEYLDEGTSVKIDVFEEKVWPTIKEIYKPYDPVAEAEEKRKKRQKRSRMYDEAIPRSRLRRMRDYRDREEMVQPDEDYDYPEEDMDPEEVPEDVDWDELKKRKEGEGDEDGEDGEEDEGEGGEEEGGDPDDPIMKMKRKDRVKFLRKQRRAKERAEFKKKREEHAEKRKKIKIKRKPLPKPDVEETGDLDYEDDMDYPHHPDGDMEFDEFGREPQISDEPPIEDDVGIDDGEGDDDDEDDEYNDEEDEEDNFPPRGASRGDVGDPEDYDYSEKEKKPEEDSEDGPMPEYDEETKNLIAIADEARSKFNEVNDRYKRIEHELGEISGILGLDLGENNEFYPLKGECFEYTDREYTYKYCPFDKTSQRNKHGGQETNLGSWGKWDGDKHDAMMFEKGQNCWHGPDRSCKVIIKCSPENKLSYATEPNRCEYEFEFHSPVACRTKPSFYEKDPMRDEL